MLEKLIDQFEALNLGYLEELRAMGEDDIQFLIEDLYELQEAGELDLETSEGVNKLKETVEKYLPL